MEPNISLITTIAAGFGVALILGFIAERIKVPALVGYLMAGILIGPATPGFVADVHIASQLSEIGIMLLNPLNTALTIAASLGHIGEFSIILAGLGLSLGVLPAEGMSLVLSGVLISIALNSFLFAAIEPFRS